LKVLIIEDQPRKREQIRSVIEGSVGDLSIEEAPSYHAGIDRVLQGDVDMLLLDMTIPVYEDQHDGRKSAMWIYGGEEVLRQIKRKQVRTSVIIVTAFDYFSDGKVSRTLDDLKIALEAQFQPQYKGTVLYKSGTDAWKTSLTELLARVRKHEKPG
jgi:CheY-like chemotaxis protein